MSGITIELKGLDQALAGLDVKKFEKELQDELDVFGIDVERDAIDLVPVDEGFLKSSIHTVFGKLKLEIVVTADYAAYVEFGTRKFAAAHIATLPTEWQQFAADFKGPGGGSFEELVMRMVGWCKRKGIEEKAAYLIAIKILRDGVQDHPFLYPAFEHNRIELVKRLKALVK